MSYTEAKEIIGAWRKQLAQGGDNDRAMIHEIVRLRTALAAATQRIAELEAWIDAVPTGALIDYYYGSEAVSYDARQAAVGGGNMSIHTDFPLPWHITYTARHRARGYNSHIRAADDSYVAERITNEDLALYIVEVVNDRYELRDELAAATARTEAAERDRTHWAECWRDGGSQHYACAVAEAEQLRVDLAAATARAEAAEAELAEYIAWIDALPRWALDQAITALARGEQSEVQP